ncbi:hypothetical protein [Streptomyces sp. NPDC097619]|uniref:hypothetical protein n=1 Tax=Streptomyces sp. NPDC097619 TaxID=3157228 RepID=UPI0033255525
MPGCAATGQLDPPHPPPPPQEEPEEQEEEDPHDEEELPQEDPEELLSDHQLPRREPPERRVVLVARAPARAARAMQIATATTMIPAVMKTRSISGSLH